MRKLNFQYTSDPKLHSEYKKFCNPENQKAEIKDYIVREMMRGLVKKLRVVHLNAYTLYQWGVKQALDPEENRIRFLHFNKVEDALSFLEFVYHGNYGIDLIITDLVLAEMNGYEVAKRIRRMEKLNRRIPVPILLLTTVEEKNILVQKGIQEGCFNKILSSGVDSGVIMEAIIRMVKA